MRLSGNLLAAAGAALLAGHFGLMRLGVNPAAADQFDLFQEVGAQAVPSCAIVVNPPTTEPTNGPCRAWGAGLTHVGGEARE